MRLKMRADAAAKQAVGQPQASQAERVAIGVTTRSMAAKMRIEAENAAGRRAEEAARIHLSHARLSCFVVRHWTRGAGSDRLSSL